MIPQELYQQSARFDLSGLLVDGDGDGCHCNLARPEPFVRHGGSATPAEIVRPM